MVYLRISLDTWRGLVVGEIRYEYFGDWTYYHAASKGE